MRALGVLGSGASGIPGSEERGEQQVFRFYNLRFRAEGLGFTI